MNIPAAPATFLKTLEGVNLAAIFIERSGTSKPTAKRSVSADWGGMGVKIDLCWDNTKAGQRSVGFCGVSPLMSQRVFNFQVKKQDASTDEWRAAPAPP